MNITAYQAGLMHHTAGMISGENRNFFGTSGGRDFDEFSKLVDGGYATSSKPVKWMDGEVIFKLTRAGIRAATEMLPEPEPVKKLTRSQNNYSDYLDADSGLTFAEHMGWKS